MLLNSKVNILLLAKTKTVTYRSLGTPYSLTLPEDTPVDTTVFTELLAEDADSGSNMQIEYSVVPGDGSDNDGFNYFVINLPHQVQPPYLAKCWKITCSFCNKTANIQVEFM